MAAIGVRGGGVWRVDAGGGAQQMRFGNTKVAVPRTLYHICSATKRTKNVSSCKFPSPSYYYTNNGKLSL